MYVRSMSNQRNLRTVSASSEDRTVKSNILCLISELLVKFCHGVHGVKIQIFFVHQSLADNFLTRLAGPTMLLRRKLQFRSINRCHTDDTGPSNL